MTKKWYAKLPEKYNFKIDHVSSIGNPVCKKLSKKSLAALRADGYMVKKMPNGTYVICRK